MTAVRATYEELKNGLRVILAPMPTQSVTVLAMVGVGSRYEDDQTAGISHFLEHMVFKGTKRYPTPKKLASTIDSVGAEFNAFTSKEYTGYYVKAASEHTGLALDVVSDMLLNPLLGASELEREKGVIVEEIHMYEDTPARHIGDVFERMMFAGSSLGRDIIGTEQTVKSFSRDHFTRHLSDWYNPSNVVLAVAGDSSVVNPKLLKEIEQYFGKTHEKRQAICTTKELKQRFRTNPISVNKTMEIAYKDTQQAHFVMAFEGLKRSHPDRYAVSILATILGGNMSSRLFTQVREKRGLCYYIRSEDDAYHDSGIFGASAGVDPTRVEEAVKVVREQLDLIAQSPKDGGITEQEVAKAKNHAVGSAILSFEDSMSIAQFYAGRKLLRDEMISIEEELARLKQVTPEQVAKLARQLVNQDKLFFAIIGPYRDQAIFEKALSK